MYKDNKIAVVIPAYNEEKLIIKTITTLPNFIDKIIVIDDNSKDNTQSIVESLKKDFQSKLILISNNVNIGVGGAIKIGYKKSLELDMDITVVMAGDAQMDPKNLQKLLDPIIENRADYTKGNRLISSDLDKMPKTRRRGNAILTILTKIASGYWNVMDPQNGYTAASKEVLKILTKEKTYLRYGYCNDFLVRLNIYNFRIMDIMMRPVYQQEESGIKLRSYTPKLSWLLIKLFFYRINKKYGGVNFHPLLLFYYLGLILTPVGIMLGLYLLYVRLLTGSYTSGSVTLVALILLLGVQFLMFAMLFDEMENRGLLSSESPRDIKRVGFFKRIKKYKNNDLHPFLFLYIGGLIMLTIGGSLGIFVLYRRFTIGSASYTIGTLMIIVLFIIMGFQSMLFGRVFELEAERNNK